MPYKPKTPCRHPGCPEKAEKGGYCEKHKKQIRKKYDNERGTSAQRGYGARWQKARKIYLREHPLCVKCLEEGQVTAATVVDHIIPHKGDYGLFWDVDNWQSLCERHHNEKTAKEDGGFGK